MSSSLNDRKRSREEEDNSPGGDEKRIHRDNEPSAIIPLNAIQRCSISGSLSVRFVYYESDKSIRIVAETDYGPIVHTYTPDQGLLTLSEDRSSSRAVNNFNGSSISVFGGGVMTINGRRIDTRTNRPMQRRHESKSFVSSTPLQSISVYGCCRVSINNAARVLDHSCFTAKIGGSSHLSIHCARHETMLLSKMNLMCSGSSSASIDGELFIDNLVAKLSGASNARGFSVVTKGDLDASGASSITIGKFHEALVQTKKSGASEIVFTRKK